jgi:hypothetical protein
MLDFTKISLGFNTLASDVSRIIVNEGKKKGASLQTVEDMTVIRKDKHDIERAKADPTLAFIKDSISKILSGK